MQDARIERMVERVNGRIGAQSNKDNVHVCMRKFGGGKGLSGRYCLHPKHNWLSNMHKCYLLIVNLVNKCLCSRLSPAICKYQKNWVGPGGVATRPHLSVLCNLLLPDGCGHFADEANHHHP